MQEQYDLMQDLCKLVQNNEGLLGFSAWQPPTQPLEALKMKQLCVELEQAKHPVFYSLLKWTKLWVLLQKKQVFITTMSK